MFWSFDQCSCSLKQSSRHLDTHRSLSADQYPAMTDRQRLHQSTSSHGLSSQIAPLAILLKSLPGVQTHCSLHGRCFMSRLGILQFCPHMALATHVQFANGPCLLLLPTVIDIILVCSVYRCSSYRSAASMATGCRFVGYGRR